MVIVSDTSPLINLAIIGHLDLIPRLFQSVILPQSVLDEIVTAGAGLPGADEIRQADWVEVRTCQNQFLVQTLMEKLDPGEAEAIALALEIRADLILMDEDLGRKIALEYHLQPLGTLGILLKAKQSGLIFAVKPLMDSLIVKARFFIHQKLYDDVLQLAGE
jgi:hypothetical protein